MNCLSSVAIKPLFIQPKPQPARHGSESTNGTLPEYPTSNGSMRQTKDKPFLVFLPMQRLLPIPWFRLKQTAREFTPIQLNSGRCKAKCDGLLRTFHFVFSFMSCSSNSNRRLCCPNSMDMINGTSLTTEVIVLACEA